MYLFIGEVPLEIFYKNNKDSCLLILISVFQPGQLLDVQTSVSRVLTLRDEGILKAEVCMSEVVQIGERLFNLSNLFYNFLYFIFI